MAIILRALAWNIAHCSLTGNLPANSLLPGIANEIRAQNPDLVFLNEVKNWDGISGWMGGNVLQAQEIARLADIPFVQWANTVSTGLTGHIAVAVLSRYPLGPLTYHPVLRGTEATSYGILETSVVVDNRTHLLFSLRFDAHNEEDNVAGHQQLIDIVQSRDRTASIIVGGDFNASMAQDWQFRRLCEISGLLDAFQARPDPAPCTENSAELVDHVFYRPPYGVTNVAVRCPWSGAPQELSDHPWVLAELSSPEWGFAGFYGSVIKMKHRVTGNHLHSHAINYSHPGTSGQQQVTVFAGANDNDLWKIKGPHGQPEDYRATQGVQHGDIVRLEHVGTRKNLHSHAGIPSPVTARQEVTCFGTNGIGDSNDNWRIEIEGGGLWQSGKRVRLIHVNTNHALHSQAGFSHPQYTTGQQEVAGFSGRDDNDWWYLCENRPVASPPVACFTMNPSSGLVGQSIAFDGSCTSDPDGHAIVGYQWSFGDGKTGSGPSVSHKYSTAGAYVVRLTVTDSMGASDSTTQRLLIEDTMKVGRAPEPSQ